MENSVILTPWCFWDVCVVCVCCSVCVCVTCVLMNFPLDIYAPVDSNTFSSVHPSKCFQRTPLPAPRLLLVSVWEAGPQLRVAPSPSDNKRSRHLVLRECEVGSSSMLLSGRLLRGGRCCDPVEEVIFPPAVFLWCGLINFPPYVSLFCSLMDSWNVSQEG